MVMEVVLEDVGEGNMQCANHPYKKSTPGGICAFCLQEKLGKLVSSSYPVAVFPSSSSSSSSPSFRPAFSATTTAVTSAGEGGSGSLTFQLRHLASSAATTQSGANYCNYHGYCTRKSRLLFGLTHKKNKNKDEGSSESTSMVFKRSKSIATPRRGNHSLDENCYEDYSPNRRGFWSFLYSFKQSTSKKCDRHWKNVSSTSSVSSNGGAIRSKEKQREDFAVVDENVSPDQAAIDRKVSRSRSVGCGSRSFSGDFFERISTGFGDCTLRRVESQREGKPKMQSIHKNGCVNGQECIKERVKCGGIFNGFMITSSASSYLIEDSNINGKSTSESQSSIGNLSHGRSKTWGWSFASPMRAFSKTSAVKRDASSNKNLAAVPSLLAVSG